MTIYNLQSSVYNGKRYFSWKLKGEHSQADYRIRILDQRQQVVWDSGTCIGKERHNIPCQAELEKGQSFTWELFCHDTGGNEAYAKGEPFETPIRDWKAQWTEPTRIRKAITDCTDPHEKIVRTDPLERLDPAVYFRKVFQLEELPEYAHIYMTAHGIYQLWVNKVLVSDLLAPGYTSYEKRLEYQCAEIAKYLVKGKNTVCAVTADGWYTGKIGAVGVGCQYGTESALLFQIDCENKDGSAESIWSDRSVKWNTGAWSYADLFIGEYYDEASELTGWMDAEYDDSQWKPVRIRDFGYQNLELQSIPAVQETRAITPKILHTPNGEMVLDAGETIVGYVGFQLNLKEQDTVSLEHSETLDAEGNFLQNIMGHNKDQKDHYRAARDGVHRWKPSFTYHGFRYVRVEGTKDDNPGHYVIYVIETPKDPAGNFTCSDERLNRLQENILRSQEGNMICIPTDCPQREKTGWTGDVQLYMTTACFEEDVELFIRHWLKDMEHEQLPDGQIPHIIPYIPSHDYMKPPGIEGVSSAGWSDAAVIIPWRLYEMYGDVQILKDSFPMILKYMESVRRLASEIPKELENAPEQVKKRQRYLWNTGFHYGDWLMPSVQMSGGSRFTVVQETGYIVATLMYAVTTAMMADICHVLGETALEQDYRELNQKVKEAFAEEYVKEDGTMTKDYQGVYVLALAADVLPEVCRASAVRRLTELIHENHDLLDTGFLSVPYLLPVLAQNGEKELANRLLFRDECPSWLYEVKMGATTMWEYWNGYAKDGTPDKCSMNHFAFGCVGEYLFKSILGINPLEPGFGKVRICPDLTCGLSHAEGAYVTIWGEIVVSWKLENDGAELDVTVPPDVEAEIHFGGVRQKAGCGRWHFETKR